MRGARSKSFSSRANMLLSRVRANSTCALSACHSYLERVGRDRTRDRASVLVVRGEEFGEALVARSHGVVQLRQFDAVTGGSGLGRFGDEDGKTRFQRVVADVDDSESGRSGDVAASDCLVA